MELGRWLSRDGLTVAWMQARFKWRRRGSLIQRRSPRWAAILGRLGPIRRVWIYNVDHGRERGQWFYL